MIYREIIGNRTHTYSDTYKIRQLETGNIYDDAMDVIPHQYEETDIPLEREPEDDLTDALNALEVFGIKKEEQNG